MIYPQTLGTQVNICCVATCEQRFNFNSIMKSLVSNAYSCHREMWNEKKGQENPFPERKEKCIKGSKLLSKFIIREEPFLILLT